MVAEQCLLCGATLYRDVSLAQICAMRPIQFDCLCPACRSGFKLYTLTDNRCVGCGRPFQAAASIYQQEVVQHYCKDCATWLKRYDASIVRHQALLDYTSTLREWLFRYKYVGCAHLAKVVAKELAHYARRNMGIQWLVLPSAPEHLKTRGFHPTAHLLKAAGIRATCPFIYCGDGRRQASKNKQERLTLQQPFRVDSTHIRRCLQRKKRWLLFDDVYTTGATMIQAKVALREALGSKWESIALRSLSLARDSLQDE